MIRISRFKLDNRAYQKLFDLTFEVIGQKHNKEDFNKILFDLLSPSERIMFAKRIAIIYLLMKDIDYQIICSVLKVSNGTVSKFRLIKEKSIGIIPAIEKILKDEKISLFFLELLNILIPPGTPHTNWQTGWERKMEIKYSSRTQMHEA